MKKLLFALSLMSYLQINAQKEYIAYTATGKGVGSTFVTDYHCLGINPANLGWKTGSQRFTTGSSEVGLSIYSASLAKQDLRDNLWGVIRSGSMETLSDSDKIDAAMGFADDFAFNFDYNFFGLSFQNEKFGGLAFSMRSRATWASGLSEDFSKLLFQGRRSAYFDSLQYFNGVDTVNIANYQNMDPDSVQNVTGGTASVPLQISQILGADTYLRLSLCREYHIGYGRKLIDLDSNFQLYAGVGAKYIEGIAMMDMGMNSAGNFEMFSAFSPSFNLDYDSSVAMTNPSAIAGSPNQIWRKPVGRGFGLDFGVNASLFKIIHLAASVTNIGSMKYTGNLYTAVDTLVVSYSQDGIDNMNVANSVGEMLEKNGLLRIQGESERKMILPATLRFGASAELGKFVHLGAEMVAPFNNAPGSINGFAWGLGSDIKVAQGKIIMMCGLTGGGGYDFQIPLGVTFRLGNGAYECGIASRDALTFFLKNSPTISAAFGFARCRF